MQWDRREKLGEIRRAFSLATPGEIPALEVDGDGGAFAGGGLDGDGVAQLAEGAAAEIQADAGGALVHPAQLAGVAPLKHPGQVLRAMPRPVS